MLPRQIELIEKNKSPEIFKLAPPHSGAQPEARLTEEIEGRVSGRGATADVSLRSRVRPL